MCWTISTGGIWAGNADRDRRWDHDTVSLSFSTGKGVASTVVHRLAERGLIDYDAPVARYWPEFAAAGKQAISLRQLLCHQAGLPAIREMLPTEALYDWQAMVDALAAEGVASLSIYSVAERAQIPPSSVYHFFRAATPSRS